jgi:hypothetical protein
MENEREREERSAQAATRGVLQRCKKYTVADPKTKTQNRFDELQGKD